MPGGHKLSREEELRRFVARMSNAQTTKVPAAWRCEPRPALSTLCRFGAAYTTAMLHARWQSHKHFVV